ncbi:MAG: FkbM family methyltransferase [Chitinophagaceae bacterium]
MNAFLKIEKFFDYYKLFGVNGIKFLADRALKKNTVINIVPKNYNHPVFLRNNTSDVEAFWQIFDRLDYELDYGGSPKSIIDCGANAGFASVYLKNKFPDATIIAVEPEPSNFKILSKNTEKYSNIHCLNYGIWNKTTNLEIINMGTGNWGFSTNEVDYENENTIKAISIDEIMVRYNLQQIDILKVDIEGSEKEMFEKNFEKWLPLTKTIVIELHDWMRHGCTKSVFKAIGNYNFSASFKGENLICKMDVN